MHVPAACVACLRSHFSGVTPQLIHLLRTGAQTPIADQSTQSPCTEGNSLSKTSICPPFIRDPHAARPFVEALSLENLPGRGKAGRGPGTEPLAVSLPGASSAQHCPLHTNVPGLYLLQGRGQSEGSMPAAYSALGLLAL